MEDFLGLKKGEGTGTTVLSRFHTKYTVRSLNARASILSCACVCFFCVALCAFLSFSDRSYSLSIFFVI